MRLLFSIACMLFLTGCNTKSRACYLQSVETIDEHGFSQTISEPTRLIHFSRDDLFANKPYRKLTKIFKRDKSGIVRSIVSTYYSSGHIKQFLECKDNRANGKYFEWHENGQLKIDALVLGGLSDINEYAEQTWVFDGKCFAYHTNGQIECELTYINGKREGEAKIFYENGQLKEQSKYKLDLLECTKESFYEHGELKSQETYSQGNINGICKQFYNKKLICIENFENGLLINATYTNESGTILGSIRNGKGTKIIIDNGYVSQKQNYSEGKQDGPIKYLDHHSNMYRVANYKDGQQHGEDTEYYTNTNTKKPQIKSLVTWNFGDIDGVVKTWYKNGKLQSSHHRVSNLRDGPMSCYYSNGNIMLLEEFKEGKLISGKYFSSNSSKPVSKVENGTGIAIIFNDDGSINKKIVYKNGTPFVRD